MHRYKPSKIPLFIFWAILAVILFLIRYAVNLIEKLIPFSVNYILMPMWIIAALFCLLVLPFYFIRSYFTVSSKEVTAFTGLFFTMRHFMPTSAIKSVTTIITPLGSITGLNFVVLNALGARLLIPFMSRRDAMEISAIVNKLHTKQRTQRRLDTKDRKGLNEPQRNYQRKKKLAEEFLRPPPAPYNDIILYN